MIDPLRRWGDLGEKPDFAGLLTWAGVPYTEEPDELEGADVAIIGAPTDDLVSDHPGARLGPRAIRAASGFPGARVGSAIDPFTRLRIVDYGDAAVRPGDPEHSHAAVRRLVGDVVASGAVPLVLGGDHAITADALRACAAAHGPLGVVHFDSHTDTETEVFGVAGSHGTVMRHLVEEGAITPGRFVQVGLRGYWPGPETFAWQARRGITHFSMDDIGDRGLPAVVQDAVRAAGDGPLYLTVDIDVVDPGSAPGTGTPEPGGLLPRELLWSVTRLARNLDIVGADVVEVIPEAVGSADPTALLADRVLRCVLDGIASRRGEALPPSARGARAEAGAHRSTTSGGC